MHHIRWHHSVLAHVALLWMTIEILGRTSLMLLHHMLLLHLVLQILLLLLLVRMLLLLGLAIKRAR